MLVICEFYEVDGLVYCDVMCEHCGEVAKKWLLREEVIEDMVLQGKEPILCQDCVDSKCGICGRFPLPSDQWLPGGLCWECGHAVNIIERAMFEAK